MMEAWELFHIELRPGEEVVGVSPYRDYLIVITNLGTVYKIQGNDW